MSYHRQYWSHTERQRALHAAIDHAHDNGLLWIMLPKHRRVEITTAFLAAAA